MSREDDRQTRDEFTPDHGSHRDTVRSSWLDSDSASSSVVDAVAAVTGTAPERLDPLYDTVDPDALDRVFERITDAPRRSSLVSISFRYAGCDVSVREDGDVVVSIRDEARL